MLLPGLGPEVLDASADGDAGADFLLTLAEIQRRLGRVPQAQQTLDECIRRCEQYGLTSIRVRARREQAELHAAGGDFQAAFEEHKLYSQEALDLQSAQRDARARALQAMYETTEARRQSRRYRELSLRDPLTGLYNRRYVDEQLAAAARRRRGEPAGPVVSVALLDLDHFKRVNDTCSHDVGRPGAAHRRRAARAGGTAAGGRRRGLLRRPDGRRGVPAGARRAPSAADAAEQLDELRRTVAAHPWASWPRGCRSR